MHFFRAVLSLFIVISASVAFGQEADLGVQKLGPGEVSPGSDVSYTVTVFNAGPDDASTVTLNDPIPAGMSFVSATQDTGPTFACDNTVTCTIATFPAGESATFTFVFHIDSGTEFLNSVTVSSQTFDPNEENDSSVAFTVVGEPEADMAIAKSAAPSAGPDTDVTFFITLTNAGPDAAASVLLTDNLPAPLTFVSFTQTSGPPMSCGTSTCTLASFPAGAAATFELTGHVPAGTPAGTAITNTATVESQNDPGDENNSATTTVTVSAADVRIQKSGPPAAVAGTTVTYTITVTNDGPDLATNVNVTDPQVCPFADCAIGNLANGASVVIDGDVIIPPDATSWSNTATVTADSYDPDPTDNSATVNTTITQSADLSVTKTAAASVVAGTSLTYTITVSNAGPSDASNVVVTDTLPAGTTFVSSSCGANPCNLGTLAAGGSEEITLVVNVAVDAASPLQNTVAVTSAAADPDPVDNTFMLETTVTPAPADLTITKTVDPEDAVVGQDVTYTIVVTNQGPGTATGVVVTDDLPAGVTVVSNSCGANPCNIGTLAAGASATITIVVTLPSTPGEFVNTASVDSTSEDPTPGNDASSAALDSHLPLEAVPALSPIGLAFLAITIAATVLVVLRRVS